MPDFAAVAGMVAGALGLLSYVPYVRSIFAGKTRPNRATWWIWTVLGTVLTASYYAVGARDTVWFTGIATAGTIGISLLSLKYGVGGWTPLDRACLGGAALGLGLWFITGTPLAALSLTMFVDMLGYVPTLRKAYCEPESEDRMAWTLFLAGAILNLAAVRTWTFGIAAFPVYVAVLNGIVFSLLVAKRRPEKAKKAG